MKEIFLILLQIFLFLIIEVNYFLKNLKILEFLILLQYLILCIIIYRKDRKITFTFLFLSVFGLYNYPQIVLSFLYSAKYTLEMVHLLIPTQENIINSLNILAVFIFGMGFYLSINFTKKTLNKISLQNTNKIFSKLIFLLLILLLIPIFYKTKLQLNYINEFGYLSLYNGGLKNISYPIWTKGAMTVYPIVFYSFLSCYPNKKYFYMGSLVYLLGNLIMSIRGSRMLLISQVLVIIIYYLIRYEVKIKLLKTCFIGILLMILSNIIRIKRSATYIDGNIFEHIMNFIKEQGASFNIIPLYMDYKSTLPLKINMSLFSEYLNFYNNNNNMLSSEYVEKTSSISVNLIYKIMPEVYLNGGGLGNNFLVDLYSFGGNWFIFFIGILLGKICEKISGGNFKEIFIVLIIIMTLFMAPRGGLLVSIFWIKVILIYILFKSLIFINKKFKI